MTWDINKVSEQIRQDTARNIQQWKESFKQNSNKFDKGGSTKKKSSSDVDSSNKEQFIKEMNKELSLRPDLDTPAFKQYLMKIAQQESGYKANAQNPASSASGYFQLIKANQTTGDQWEDMIRLTRENLAAINRLSPSLKKMAAEKGLDKWDLLALAHFQGKGKLPGIIQGDNPKDATGTSTATYLNRFRGGKGASKDYDYSYSAPKVQDVNYSDVVGDSSPREEEPSIPAENSFLKMINARVAETQAAMDALHEEMSGAKQNPSKSIFASNTEEESSLYNTARTPQYAQVPQQVATSQDNIPFDSDTYYAALEQRYMPDQLSPLDELVNSYTQSNELALGGPVNPDNPIPNFAQYTHQKLPAVRYAEGGGMNIGFTPNTNVDFNVKPQEEVAPEMPVNTKPSTNVNTNPSVGLGAFQGQELPSENVMFPGVANNTKLTKEQLQQNTTKSWNENRDFNASPEFYDDYSWRVKKHHPEVTDEAFNAVKNTTPIVTRKLGTRLGQYQVRGQYVPWSGAVQVDKFNGLFPDIVSHEMGHAFDYKLNLTGTTTGGNLDKALLNKAYPTVHGVTDDDIDERRAVNTQLRSVIQKNSGKSKADLDTHIQNMTTEDMQKAVEGMHTGYLKKAAVNDLSLPDMKKALQDVAFNNRQQNPNYNIAAYGGNIYDGTTEESQRLNIHNRGAAARARMAAERKAYLQTSEGQEKLKRLQQQDEAFFHNAKSPGVQKGLGRLQKAQNTFMQQSIDTQFGKDIQQAAEQQMQDRKDKIQDYKTGIEATMNAAELGLSGLNLLRAYGNFNYWKNAHDKLRPLIINLLNRKSNQVTLNGAGTVIDAAQLYGDINDESYGKAAWDGAGMVLGGLGTLGAMDAFRGTSPKVDVLLDAAGVAQSTGDIGKFVWDSTIPFIEGSSNSSNKKSNKYDGTTEKTQQMNTPHLALGDPLFYDMVTDPITGETKYQNNDGTWLQEIHNADGTTSYVNNNGQELVPSRTTILPEPVITPKNGKITDGGLILDANNNPIGNAFTNAPVEKPLESVSPEFAALTLPRAAINGALKLTTQEAAEFAPTMIGAYKDGTLAKAGLDMAVGGLGADVVDNVSRGIYGKTWGEELADETGLPVGLTDFTNPGWFTGSLAKPLTPLADLINKGVTKGITAFDNAGKALDFYHYNPANYVKDKVSFYPHENSFTRGIGGTAGLQDLIESQVIRGNKLSDPNVEVFRKGPFGITLKMDKNTLLNSNREAHIPTIEYSKGNTQNPQGEKQQQIKKQLIDFFQQHGIKEPSKMTNDKWNDIWSDMSSQFWDEKGPGADQVGELAETFPETEFRDMTDDQVLDYISDMWVPNREVLQEEKIAPLTYHKLVSLPKILKTISEEMDEGIRIGTVPVDINKEGILKDITDIYTTKLEKMPVSQGATKPNVGGWYMKGIDKKIRIPRGEIDDTALAHEYHHAARDLVQNYLKSKNLSHLLSPYAKSRKGVYGSSDEYFPSEYDALGFLNMRNEDSESYTAMNEMGATTVGDLGYTLWKQISEDLGKDASLDEFLSYVETMKNNKKLYPLLKRTNAYALDIEDYLNNVGNDTRARRTATKRADAIWDTVQGEETEPAWHYSTNPDVQKALEDVQKSGYADMVNKHYKKFSFKDRWKLLRNNPELLTPSNTGDIIKWLLGENLRESAALLLKTEKGKDLFNTAMNKKLWEMFKTQTDVHTEELINEEIANVLSKLGAVGVPAAIGTTTVTQNRKALGGPLNLFANGGRAQFNKDYPGLAGIQFNVVPDTNFNARNVGFGNIEYMPQGEEGVQYTPDYYYPNPDPSTNNVVYNPNNYSSQQAANEAVALDAISHAGHQDATYDALHTLLSNEYPNEAVMQAKDMVGNDKVFEKEMKDPYSDTRQFTYPAAVDGQVRGYMFEGIHPDKNDPAYEEQNYYPYFREEFQKYESADANRYLSDLSRYVTTGKRPKYILPEVKVTGKKRK